MGHYLSDFETHDEYMSRTVYRVLRERLRVYDEEQKRGLMHTDTYQSEMEKARATLAERDQSRGIR